jgi:hypothetical protein
MIGHFAVFKGGFPPLPVLFPIQGKGRVALAGLNLTCGITRVPLCRPAEYTAAVLHLQKFFM